MRVNPDLPQHILTGQLHRSFGETRISNAGERMRSRMNSSWEIFAPQTLDRLQIQPRLPS